MPAKSKRQRRLMAMALRYKRGDKSVLEDLTEEGKKEVKRLARTMTIKQLEDFAQTKEKGLPELVKKRRKKKKRSKYRVLYRT